MPEVAALERLVAEDLVSFEHGRPRTTRRWQRAMVRAAARLYEGALPYDLRYPIALALVELLGNLDEPELTDLLEAMLPIEQAELSPVTASRPCGTSRP